MSKTTMSKTTMSKNSKSEQAPAPRSNKLSLIILIPAFIIGLAFFSSTEQNQECQRCHAVMRSHSYLFGVHKKSQFFKTETSRGCQHNWADQGRAIE